MRKQRGFTLIEIAIVLVIIGLLLGGVLKGQELITSARVRNLISTQDGVKAAYFGFLDRYRALPRLRRGSRPQRCQMRHGVKRGQRTSWRNISPAALGFVETLLPPEHLSRPGS